MRKAYEDLMRQMEAEMRWSEDMLRRFIQAMAPGPQLWEPAVDVYETPAGLHIRVELAGVHPDDLQVEIGPDGQNMIIRGQRRDPLAESGQKPTFHQLEIFFGPFERVIRLPQRAEIDRDRVQAVYREGFLLVLLPRPVAEPRPQTIKVPVIGEEEA